MTEHLITKEEYAKFLCIHQTHVSQRALDDINSSELRRLVVTKVVESLVDEHGLVGLTKIAGSDLTFNVPKQLLLDSLLARI